MQRVLAVLGAVALVAAAVALRSLLDGDDGPGGDAAPPTLLCAEELAPVCADLEARGLAEVSVEAVGTTVDRLEVADARLDVDGWLTLDPYPELVDLLRSLATAPALFEEAVATDHSTGLALVVADEARAEALGSACADVDWACVGDAAGRPWAELGGSTAWGDVRPGYDRPDTSGSGLLVLTQAMADHLDDPGFASQDIDRRWLADLEDAVPNRRSGSTLDTLVLQGAAAFGAVGALGGDAEAAASTAQGEGLVIFYPAPMFRANVVLAPAAGRDLDDLLDDAALADALAEAGWEPGVDGDALPDAGVLDALRAAWEASA